MASHPCHWLSAQALIIDVNKNALNVTDLVDRCSNVCSLAFDSKGPADELFGPGIMVSSVIQMVLGLVLGISLPAIISTIRKFSTSKHVQLILFLRKLRVAMLQVNAFFTISLLVAAMISIRLSTAPMILEHAFISSLVEFHFLYILGIVVAEDGAKELNEPEVSWQYRFNYQFLFIAQLATSMSIGVPNKDVYVQLARECFGKDQSELIDLIGSGTNSTDYWIGGILGFFISACLISFIVFGINHVPEFISRPLKMSFQSIPSWVKGNWEMGLQFLLAGVFARSIIWSHYLWYKQRNLILQNIQAKELKWGYGQATAVLLWASFFIYAMMETRKFLASSAEPQTPPSAVSSEKEEALLDADNQEDVKP